MPLFWERKLNQNNFLVNGQLPWISPEANDMYYVIWNKRAHGMEVWQIQKEPFLVHSVIQIHIVFSWSWQFFLLLQFIKISTLKVAKSCLFLLKKTNVPLHSLNKKSFPLRISSVNLTESAHKMVKHTKTFRRQIIENFIFCVVNHTEVAILRRSYEEVFENILQIYRRTAMQSALLKLHIDMGVLL